MYIYIYIYIACPSHQYDVFYSIISIYTCLMYTFIHAHVSKRTYLSPSTESTFHLHFFQKSGHFPKVPNNLSGETQTFDPDPRTPGIFVSGRCLLASESFQTSERREVGGERHAPNGPKSRHLTGGSPPWIRPPLGPFPPFF